MKSIEAVQAIQKHCEENGRELVALSLAAKPINAAGDRVAEIVCRVRDEWVVWSAVVRADPAKVETVSGNYSEGPTRAFDVYGQRVAMIGDIEERFSGAPEQTKPASHREPAREIWSYEADGAVVFCVDRDRVRRPFVSTWAWADPAWVAEACNAYGGSQPLVKPLVKPGELSLLEFSRSVCDAGTAILIECAVIVHDNPGLHDVESLVNELDASPYRRNDIEFTMNDAIGDFFEVEEDEDEAATLTTTDAGDAIVRGLRAAGLIEPAESKS